MKFVSGPPVDSQGSVTRENIEMEPVDPLDSRMGTHEPRDSMEDIGLGDV